MMLYRFALATILSHLLLGCQPITNDYSELALSCGEGADRGKKYIQILDQKGRKLQNNELMAYQWLNLKPTPIAITRKGCVPADATPILVRHQSQALAAHITGDEFSSIQLNNESDRSIPTGCFQRSVNSPLDISHFMLLNQTHLRQFYRVYWQVYGQNEGDCQPSKGEFWLSEPSTINLDNQHGQSCLLSVAVENLWTGKIGEEMRCPITVDLVAPRVDPVFLGTNAGQLNLRDGPVTKLNPGEKIEVTASEENASIEVCLTRDPKTPCDSSNTTTYLKAFFPDQVFGIWYIRSRAMDQAGNQGSWSSPQGFLYFHEETLALIE